MARTKLHQDSTDVTVLNGDARTAALERGSQINDTYSLAGADDTLAEAGRVGAVALSVFDKAEYNQGEQERLLAAMQRNAERDAARRAAEVQSDQRDRASLIGGLAISGPLDITADTDLDELAAEDKLGLPWHLRFTGPRGNGVTLVRKRWTMEEAGRAAKVLGWDVRAVTSQWDDPELGAGASDQYRTIVRRAKPEYATDCRCAGYHARKGERRGTEIIGGVEVEQPLCGWLTSRAIGQCKSGWKADFQVEDMIEVMAELTDTGEVVPDSIGWLNGGTNVFLQTRLADTAYLLGTEDPFDVYVSLNSNYSGMGANTVLTGAVRINCRNTRRWAERTASALARVAHVGDMKGKMVDAATVLLEAQGYVRREQQVAEKLAAVELVLADYRAIADELLPLDPQASDRSRKQREGQRDELVGYLLSDETLPADLRRTGYGAREATLRWYGNDSPHLARGGPAARLNAVYDPAGAAVTAARKVQRLVLERGSKRIKTTVGRKA